MIRSLFLPDQIGDYYVFAQRLVACQLTKNHVRLTATKIAGRVRTIEQIIEVPLEDDATKSYAERAASALTQAFSSVGRYSQLSIVMPANTVIFKELRLPFTSPEKIKLVLPFEIEPLLPFALSEATVDCITTSMQADHSVVMAVAIKHETLAEQFAPYEAAGLLPTRATVDAIELYALYKALYPKIADGNILLFYVGTNSSRLEVIVQQQLKAVRFLPHGLAALARLKNGNLEQLMHSALSPDDSASAATFLGDVQFTLEAFTVRVPEDEKLQKILLMGPAADVKGLPALIEQITGLPCDTLVGQALVQHNLAKLKGNHGIPNKSVISTSASLALPASQDFNLYRAPEIVAQDTLLNRQLITAIALMVLTICSLVAHGLFNARRLRQEIQKSEKEAVDRLKKELPAIVPRVKSASLDMAIKASRAEVAREKNIWFALSTQNRASFLMYLQELSTRIDADGLGLYIDEINAHRRLAKSRR